MNDERKKDEKGIREALEEHCRMFDRIGKRHPKMTNWVSLLRCSVKQDDAIGAALAGILVGYIWCQAAEVSPYLRKASRKALLFTWRMKKSKDTTIKPNIVAAALEDYRTRLAEKPRRKKTPLQVQVARDHGIGARTFQRYLAKNPLPAI